MRRLIAALILSGILASPVWAATGGGQACSEVAQARANKLDKFIETRQQAIQKGITEKPLGDYLKDCFDFSSGGVSYNVPGIDGILNSIIKSVINKACQAAKNAVSTITGSIGSINAGLPYGLGNFGLDPKKILYDVLSGNIGKTIDKVKSGIENTSSSIPTTIPSFQLPTSVFGDKQGF